MERASLKGKIVWLTGASRGIGSAIAKELIENNAHVMLTARNIDSLNDTVNELIEAGASFFLCDIRSEPDVIKTYNNIVSTKGNIDILINNAGTGIFAPMIDLSVEDFDVMFDTNVRGTFLCTKQILPDMIKRQSGYIVNTLSVSAIKPFAGSSVYGATKAAVLMMDRILRQEVREYGIKIMSVIPGATETEIWSPEDRDKYRDRMMQPEDVAKAVISAIQLNMMDRLAIEEIVIRPTGGDL
jgi:NADP-dependent 3-hydroxy acid dehydrogenase YdfG